MKLSKNQKVFLSYAWTGEDEAVVRRRLSTIGEFFKGNSVSYYCNLEDEAISEFEKAGQFVLHALEKLSDCDYLIAIVSSERRSQGQLMEIGAALYAKKPVITALHRSAVGSGYLDDETLVAGTFVWEDESDLVEKLKDLL